MTINRNQPSHIAMTAMERVVGRYMRAPDHDATTGGGDPAPAAAPAAAAAAPAAEADPFEGFESHDAEGTDSGTRQSPAPAPGKEASSEGEGGEASDGDANADEPTGEAVEGEEESKPKNPAQQRIDELTAARREAERTASEAERQAEYWRGVAEGRIKPEAAPTAEDAPANDGPKEPDPQDYEFGETDPRFIADLARYSTLEAIASNRREEQLNTQVAAVETEWAERTKAAAAVYPDFEDKVVKAADEGKWSCSAIMALGIKTSPAGADIAYHLASNPEDSDRIAKLTPLEQAKELGRLEFRFEAEAKAKAEAAAAAEADGAVDDNKRPVTDQATKAPPPPPRARGGGGKFAPAPDTDDFAAFEALADDVLQPKK